MIDLYTWTTPNGRKISIMLEEIGLPYKAIGVNIGNREQFDPAFLEISPNNKIPAIVDQDEGVNMMESGAILIYLAEKTGKLMPQSGRAKWEALEWLMLGQTHHFVFYNEGKSPYAEERYLKENARIYGVLDQRLGDKEYLAGEYSIADIATWPWIARHPRQRMDLHEYPNLLRWYLAIAGRPAVQRGYDVPEKVEDIPIPD